MSLIETKGVQHRYARRDEEGNIIQTTMALQKITCEIRAGEFIAILGHNGSGKSTLAKHLNALLLPSEGAVLIDGMDTRDDENLWHIRQLAGMVFQNPDNQIIGQIVEEDVGFGPENLGVPTGEILSRVDEALAKVDMQSRRYSSPSKLSGGQKQRVSIAGVLAMKPKILILDEPTAMLDPAGRAEVLATAHELNRRDGITVLLITHDMDEAAGADRILVMDRGHLVMSGTPREIFARSEELTAIGLTIPTVTQIAEILRAHGITIVKTPLTRQELTEALTAYAFALHNN
ncbi:MAG: energy-coupling factor transporter ATPase [Lachnospiraceae bacterium]|nr:energy-coupling factor transporter ATPase [Lachnospiraceae bacterium]